MARKVTIAGTLKTPQYDVPFTASEESAADVAQADWKAGATDRQWTTVRAERTALLTACDWRVLPDQPVSQSWMDYRQALRDVPTQPDPNNITWPIEP